MSQTVILAENPFEPDTWITHEVPDVRSFLVDHFKVWPQTARIYHKYVAQNCDVTPEDEPGIERLGQLSGPFVVVVYPGSPIVIVAVIAVVAAIAAAYLFKPSIPQVATRNPNTPSPNNGLSDRQNSERIAGRIPDILGTVRSTPDLLAPPYSVFENFQEVEHCLMCVGRGSYRVEDVRDGDTPLSSIDGAVADFYGPNRSQITSGYDLRVGTYTGSQEPFLAVKKSSAVNGQVLLPRPRYYKENDVVVTRATARVDFNGNSDEDVRDLFKAGDQVDIKFTDGSADNLDGVYTLQSVEQHAIVLSSPGSVNAQWNVTTWTTLSARTWVERVAYAWTGPFTLGDASTSVIIANFVALNGMYKDNGNQRKTSVDIELEVTPLDASGSPLGSPAARTTTITGSATDRSSRGITLRLPVLATRPDTIPVWSMNANDVYYPGDYASRSGTIYHCNGLGGQSVPGTIDPATNPDEWTPCLFQYTAARYRVRARRLTSQVLNYDGQVVDEVKWRDLYAASDAMRDREGLRFFNFGDVTTVRTRTVATEGALSLKERKLNCLATRKIPVWIPDDPPAWTNSQAWPSDAIVARNGFYYHTSLDVAEGGVAPENTGSGWFRAGTAPNDNQYSTQLVPTTRADNILRFVCRDSFIGRRSDAELDLVNFRSTIQEVQAYFGSHKAVEFCYTYDQANVSFEETVASLAEAVFCHAYRRGSQIKLSFERATEDSTLLFNHRNVVPGSETRTVNFGMSSDNDGLEFQYVDPDDDAVVTLYFPAPGTASPKKVESVGIRNRLQAYFLAYRIWNRMRYQHVLTEFEATEEAELLLLGDRILVADNTRPNILDGDVMSQDILELTLSQRHVLSTEESWVIFLQHIDGTVESIPVTQGSASNKVVLGRAPKAPLALRTVDNDLATRALYWITKATPSREQAFLVTEREPKSNFTSVVRAVNYDGRYYDHDKDFINGVVNSNGE